MESGRIPDAIGEAVPMRIFHLGYSRNFDGPGNRLIFYCKGCNFHCDWCGAPESIRPEPEYLHYPDREELAGQEISVEQICRKAVSARDFIQGVTFGGGEPTLQYQELMKALSVLQENGFHTAIESNASTHHYTEIAAAADLVFSDLKTLDPEKFRQRIADNSDLLEMVRNNLRFAAQNAKALVIRVPVISGLNEEPDSRRELTSFLKELGQVRRNGLEVELLRQHHLAEPKYLALGRTSLSQLSIPPSRELLDAFAAELRRAGLKVKIFG